MNEKDHRTVAEEELYNKTELNVGEFLGVEPFSTIRSAVLVVPESYAISPLSRPLQMPYHGIYVNRFY